MSRSRAFSLIELLIVIAIIATLAGGSFLSYSDGFRRSAHAGRSHNLTTLRRAIDAFRSDHDRYPNSLAELVETRYLREVPVDPVTMSSLGWRLLPSRPDGDDVFDVLPPLEGGRS